MLFSRSQPYPNEKGIMCKKHAQQLLVFQAKVSQPQCSKVGCRHVEAKVPGEPTKTTTQKMMTTRAARMKSVSITIHADYGGKWRR